MNGLDKKIREIKEQKIGNNLRRALIVEGSDDVRSFELLLAKINPDWSNQWVLAEAGKKATVLDILAKEPTWLGIVDRDEWGEDKIVQLETERANLFFLPRYCIENYLIIPSELWQALPDKQKAKVHGGSDQLSSAILSELDRWVKHGVLWSVINPLWEGLRSLGFKESLLNVDIVENNDEIQRILRNWHAFLNPDTIWESYQERLSAIEAKTTDEKLKLHVHGKYFYEKVISPTLNSLLGQKSSDERQFSIIRTLPVMTELHPLIIKMGLDVDDRT